LSATIELWSDDQEFLNCRQAAAFLEVSGTTFYRMRMEKGIPFYKIGKLPKFKIDDLHTYRENQLVLPRDAVSSKHSDSPEISKVRLRGR
jgi:excisionase family DNA binding protein